MGKISNKVANFIIGIYIVGVMKCVVVLVIIIGCVKECTGPKVDPMDISVMTQMHTFKNLHVTDSVGDGFEVVYQTTRPVTKARLNEIRYRKHVEEAFDALQKDAPLHFGLMLDTDIYDFSEFAKKYDCDPDVKINSIFVTGFTKQKMYHRPSPRGDKFASGNQIFHEQGIQYIRSIDIYPYAVDPERTYRYWQCSGIYSISKTDERYSHVEHSEIRH